VNKKYSPDTTNKNVHKSILCIYVYKLQLNLIYGNNLSWVLIKTGTRLLTYTAYTCLTSNDVHLIKEINLVTTAK